MKPKTELLLRVERVVNSCKTVEQLAVARRYADRAARKLGAGSFDSFEYYLTFKIMCDRKLKVIINHG